MSQFSEQTSSSLSLKDKENASNGKNEKNKKPLWRKAAVRLPLLLGSLAGIVGGHFIQRTEELHPGITRELVENRNVRLYAKQVASDYANDRSEGKPVVAALYMQLMDKLTEANSDERLFLTNLFLQLDTAPDKTAVVSEIQTSLTQHDREVAMSSQMHQIYDRLTEPKNPVDVSFFSKYLGESFTSPLLEHNLGFQVSVFSDDQNAFAEKYYVAELEPFLQKFYETHSLTDPQKRANVEFLLYGLAYSETIYGSVQDYIYNYPDSSPDFVDGSVWKTMQAKEQGEQQHIDNLLTWLASDEDLGNDIASLNERFGKWSRFAVVVNTFGKIPHTAFLGDRLAQARQFWMLTPYNSGGEPLLTEEDLSMLSKIDLTRLNDVLIYQYLYHQQSPFMKEFLIWRTHISPQEQIIWNGFISEFNYGEIDLIDNYYQFQVWGFTPQDLVEAKTKFPDFTFTDLEAFFEQDTSAFSDVLEKAEEGGVKLNAEETRQLVYPVYEKDIASYVSFGQKLQQSFPQFSSQEALHIWVRSMGQHTITDLLPESQQGFYDGLTADLQFLQPYALSSEETIRFLDLMSHQDENEKEKLRAFISSLAPQEQTAFVHAIAPYASLMEDRGDNPYGIFAMFYENNFWKDDNKNQYLSAITQGSTKNTGGRDANHLSEIAKNMNKYMPMVDNPRYKQIFDQANFPDKVMGKAAYLEALYIDSRIIASVEDATTKFSANNYKLERDDEKGNVIALSQMDFSHATLQPSIELRPSSAELEGQLSIFISPLYLSAGDGTFVGGKSVSPNIFTQADTNLVSLENVEGMLSRQEDLTPYAGSRKTIVVGENGDIELADLKSLVETEEGREKIRNSQLVFSVVPLTDTKDGVTTPLETGNALYAQLEGINVFTVAVRGADGKTSLVSLICEGTLIDNWDILQSSLAKKGEKPLLVFGADPGTAPLFRQGGNIWQVNSLSFTSMGIGNITLGSSTNTSP